MVISDIKVLFVQVLCTDGVVELLRHQFILWPWDMTAKQNERKFTAFLEECGLGDVSFQIFFAACHALSVEISLFVRV